MADVVFTATSPPLTCGCPPWQVQVYRKGTDVKVPGVMEVNVTRGLALTVGEDVECWWTEGVEARCQHGVITEDRVR